MPIRTINTSETVAGYAIQERIGAGGYGEVWSAIAPGGITKAIKIIYGYHEEDRAERELKALNRIKEVRHPFLLSLERIEVVDGQLIVVTELADLSLKDRFDQCISQGESGIPRDELIGYLNDTAEALDYISQAHSLQHLDVKPENLLLLGGHVKVADFGLVKEIEDATASLMGGLTPIYAAPELFDGQPCQFSDQYSLAIVFQEMLTGIRPFSGTTAAQLAAQHLQSRPKLSSLPRADQVIVGRALAKDPKRRFPDCRAMVGGILKSDALHTHVKHPAGPRPARKSADTEIVTPSAIQAEPTELVRNIAKESIASIKGFHFLRESSKDVKDLPPLEWNRDAARLCPTLFVGIGRTATRTLAKLRRRLIDRLGKANEIPAIRMLCLDTDRRDLLEASRGEGESTLELDETLAMPLRTPEEYRANSKKHLSWLSRRWLYNMPRTLQSEGLRPLGRLAFADHAAEFLDRLQVVLSDMTSKESISTSAKTTGLSETDGEARAFILASVSGGTGSGMALDVAYAVRNVMTELGLPDNHVCGILLHSAKHLGSQHDLAIANTIAFLTELYHYSCVDGYPGDSSCGLPPFQDNRPTFSDTYLIHLGEDLREDDFDLAADQLAEYLYLGTVTECLAAFDACREQTSDADAPADAFHLRTIGLTQIGCSSGKISSTVANLLCRSVVALWLGKEESTTRANDGTPAATESTFDLSNFVSEQAKRLGFTVEGLIKRVHQAMKQEWGAKGDQHLVNVLQEIISQQRGLNAPQMSEVLHRLDAEMGIASDGNGNESKMSRSDKRLSRIANETASTLSGAIMELVDLPKLRIHGAEAASEMTRTRLLQIEKTVNTMISKLRSELSEVERELLNATPSEGGRSKHIFRKNRGDGRFKEGQLEEQLLQYARLKRHEFLLINTLKLTKMVDTRLSKIGGQLLEMRRELVKLAKCFPNPATREEEECDYDDDELLDEEDDPVDMLSHVLIGHLPALAKQLDQQMHVEYFQEHGGLSHILIENARERRELPVVLQSLARAAVLDTIDKMDVPRIILDSDAGPERIAKMLDERLAQARPKFLECGGAKRLLLAAPKGQSSDRFSRFMAEKFDEKPTVVEGVTGNLTLCYETEQVPLANVAISLIGNRPERAEYAKRLHTRVDVDWSRLTDNN